MACLALYGFLLGDRDHEVVLPRTFQYAEDTRFDMMASNQETHRKLYLTGKELGAIIQKNGVAFRPEPGTTTRLLR